MIAEVSGVEEVAVAWAEQIRLQSGPDTDWLTFTYDLASNAKNFARSCDQAPSQTAAELPDDIAELFHCPSHPSCGSTA